jgi:hypothetical protein
MIQEEDRLNGGDTGHESVRDEKRKAERKKKKRGGGGGGGGGQNRSPSVTEEREGHLDRPVISESSRHVLF